MSNQNDLASMNCSLANALGVVGDAWSLLILRDVFLGARRFQEIATSTGMARNILSQRLAALVDDKVLLRKGTEHRPTYSLTERGHDLVPALIALMQWGDRWLAKDGAPMLLSDHKDRPLPPVRILSEKGKDIDPKRIVVTPGPGAEPRTKEWLAALAANRE